jgi:hypothetical protein
VRNCSTRIADISANAVKYYLAKAIISNLKRAYGCDSTLKRSCAKYMMEGKLELKLNRHGCLILLRYKNGFSFLK